MVAVAWLAVWFQDWALVAAAAVAGALPCEGVVPAVVFPFGIFCGVLCGPAAVPGLSLGALALAFAFSSLRCLSSLVRWRWRGDPWGAGIGLGSLALSLGGCRLVPLLLRWCPGVVALDAAPGPPAGWGARVVVLLGPLVVGARSGRVDAFVDFSGPEEAVGLDGL